MVAFGQKTPVSAYTRPPPALLHLPRPAKGLDTPSHSRLFLPVPPAETLQILTEGINTMNEHTWDYVVNKKKKKNPTCFILYILFLIRLKSENSLNLFGLLEQCFPSCRPRSYIRLQFATTTWEVISASLSVFNSLLFSHNPLRKLAKVPRTCAVMLYFQRLLSTCCLHLLGSPLAQPPSAPVLPLFRGHSPWHHPIIPAQDVAHQSWPATGAPTPAATVVVCAA